MRHLDLDVFEPGDVIGTMSEDGKVAIFTVGPAGQMVPSDNRMFAPFDDPIEDLELATRAYNVLKREHVNSISQMIAIYDEKGVAGFDAMRNLGEKSRNEIIAVIHRLKEQSHEQEGTS